MSTIVRRATMDDLPRIIELYAQARKFMAESGNPTQWGTIHPPKEQTVRDIEDQLLFVITRGQVIHGVFYLFIGPDPAYSAIYDGVWHSDAPYGTIHRIAGDGSGGILRSAVEYGSTLVSYLRLDTHENNRVMRRCAESLGFQKCGIIHLSNGEPRIAYDRIGGNSTKIS